jgi:adenosylcobyric acid synthase
MVAPTLMVQGTASSVGKSLLTTALCRYFARQGLRVAPFKGLNMALNAHVTPQGFEIARAQAVQAAACGVELEVEMNPVLLKPEGPAKSQLVLLGKAQATLSAKALFDAGFDLKAAVLDALAALRSRYDLVLIEGAGSPAEVNLRDRDIANMFVARHAKSPVLLAGDIDRGGVLAAFAGTLALLTDEERGLVKALVVNKFRGDLSLLTPGLTWLHDYTKKPVLGVMPHLGRLRFAEEDSLDVDARGQRDSRAGAALRVAVIRLPRLSNHDEFQPFEHEPDVSLVFTDDPAVLLDADLVIVPGSKSTVADLAWLRAQGLDHLLRLRAQRGAHVLGICGGCQMLGGEIMDPDGVEDGHGGGEGLGLLALSTRFLQDKRTRRVEARALGHAPLFAALPADVVVPGYYIHAGVTRAEGKAVFATRSGEASYADGAVSEAGNVVGTMVHGLFEHDGLRHAVLSVLRERRGLGPVVGGMQYDRDAEYDRLADAVEAHCDTAFLRGLVGL